ncbi:MAG TPA: inositol monophosphatase family protein [Pirellulales bacterium]|jgi:myo-inositol-1(or 4)-monophosphatase
MAVIAQYAKVCEAAARAGGDVLLRFWGKVEAREKNPSDLVTEADVTSQRAIKEVVLGAFPDHGFLAEENESIPSRSDDLRWVVDPLDGTTNYVHGIPHYAVSIALVQRSKPLVGVVFEPANGNFFRAAQGEGATLNGAPIRVSRATELGKAVVATSFPPKVDVKSPEVARFIEVLANCRATRRSGSTAINLAQIAAGQIDAYWSYSTKPWDVAAGALLVREAGGVFTGPAGGAFDLDVASFVAASTAGLHADLCQTLARVPG